ncbi:MAG: metal-dependent transcriptional regulator [Erysipelotrichaceae bacterium]
MKESGEMYLETIHVLSKTNPHVRSIDVSEHMQFSKPSVSRAISILKNDGFVHMDKDGYLTLTESGLSIAEKIYQRHLILTEFLGLIGLDSDTAANDACRMEHAISDQTYAAISNHVTHLKNQ